jgi:hypothetical protein
MDRSTGQIRLGRRKPSLTARTVERAGSRSQQKSMSARLSQLDEFWINRSRLSYELCGACLTGKAGG